MMVEKETHIFNVLFWWPKKPPHIFDILIAKEIHIFNVLKAKETQKPD